MKIDKLNWTILEMLQRNARLSHAELGRAVGLSSPAIAERIRKMEDFGILDSYRAKINYTKVGYQLKALITLRAFMGRLQAFMSKVTDFNEVINCYRVTGNENILMEVVLKDQMHLQEFIDNLITYGEVKTYIILSNLVSNNPIRENY